MLTGHILFPQHPLDHLRSNVLPARTLGEIFQMIGTAYAVPTSESLCLNVGKKIIDSFIRWIYAQFIAVDANFRLKSKNRQIKDPELGSGWSYFVENTAYTRHVANNPHEKDVCIFWALGDIF